MGDVELLALYWTVGGPADVHVGRECDRACETAAAQFRVERSANG